MEATSLALGAKGKGKIVEQRGGGPPLNNQVSLSQRFVSYHAEAVQVEPGRRPILMGVFYAHAKSRADPKDFEINIWPLAGDDTRTVGPYPSRRLIVPPAAFSYEQIMSSAWDSIRNEVSCF